MYHMYCLTSLDIMAHITLFLFFFHEPGAIKVDKKVAANASDDTRLDIILEFEENPDTNFYTSYSSITQIKENRIHLLFHHRKNIFVTK